MAKNMHWVKKTFLISDYPIIGMETTKKGYECKRVFAVVKIEDTWYCIHVPSSEFLGIRSNDLYFCKKIIEFLLKAKIKWNFPTMDDVFTNNNLDIIAFKKLMHNAAMHCSTKNGVVVSTTRTDNGFITKRFLRKDGSVMRVLESKNGGESFSDIQIPEASSNIIPFR